MSHRLRLSTAVAAACLAAAGSSHAIGVTDAVGDYVSGFAGSKLGDLDVVGAFVTYNAHTDTFVFSGTMANDIGLTPGGIYVWGINRGLGTARFAASGVGGVLFDMTGSYRAAFINGIAWNLLNGVVAWWLLFRQNRRNVYA